MEGPMGLRVSFYGPPHAMVHLLARPMVLPMDYLVGMLSCGVCHGKTTGHPWGQLRSWCVPREPPRVFAMARGVCH